MSIVDQKSVGVLARLPQLLHRPLGGGVFSHTDANHAAGTDLHHHQYIKDAEPHCHRYEEVTGQQHLSVVSHKSVPSLRSCSRRNRWTVSRPVCSHRSRRDSDAEFQPEFIGDALLAPGGIVTDHFSNELAEVLWQGRAAGSGFPFPQEPERLAVPADQGRRFDDEESGPPLE
ncbi:MAG TPA: hypothetical protein VNX88_03740 [Terriglobales bacterium]|nr:hypothetical protein [Terriglobales bacterium]